MGNTKQMVGIDFVKGEVTEVKRIAEYTYEITVSGKKGESRTAIYRGCTKMYADALVGKKIEMAIGKNGDAVGIGSDHDNS